MNPAESRPSNRTAGEWSQQVSPVGRRRFLVPEHSSASGLNFILVICSSIRLRSLHVIFTDRLFLQITNSLLWYYKTCSFLCLNQLQKPGLGFLFLNVHLWCLLLWSKNLLCVDPAVKKIENQLVISPLPILCLSARPHFNSTHAAWSDQTSRCSLNFVGTLRLVLFNYCRNKRACREFYAYTSFFLTEVWGNLILGISVRLPVRADLLPHLNGRR